jgi:hypothetical protein
VAEPGALSASLRAEGGTPRLNFPVHFLLLAGAAILYLIAHGLQTSFWDHLPYAKEGALHGLAIAGALRAPPALARRAIFVLCAAALAFAAYVAGAFLADIPRYFLKLLAHDPGADTTTWIAMTAATGAAAYGFLVRALWLPQMSRSAPWLIALACAAAMLVLARLLNPDRYTEWYVVLWWFVFSGGLWWFCRQRPAADGALPEHRA